MFQSEEAASTEVLRWESELLRGQGDRGVRQ